MLDISKRSYFKKCLIAIILLLAIRFLTLPFHALSDPTEGRYALIAKDIVTSGDWITPHLWHDGHRVPFLGKPPLYFWAAAACMKVFGINEFSARLPGFLSLAVTVLLMWIVLRRYTRKSIAYRAVFILISSVVIFVAMGLVIVDMTVMMAVTGAVLSYYAFWQETDRSIRKRWSVLLFMMLAIGFLTKGPVVMVLFGMPVLIWTIRFREWAILKDHSWIWGSVVFLSIVAPWFVLCEFKNPGFLKYFFINENLLRFIVHEYGDQYGSGHEHVRGSAIWMMLVAGCPWSFYMLGRLFKYRTQISIRHLWHHQETAFFMSVVVVNTLFWSLARQLLITYLFPVVPLFAVLLSMLIAYHKPLGLSRDKLFMKQAIIIGISLALIMMICTPYIYSQRSTKAIIDQAHQMDDIHGIYFLRRVPYSAYFYSDSRIIAHPTETIEESVQNGLLTEGTVYIARQKYYKQLLRNSDYPISFLRHCGKYILFKIENKPFPPVRFNDKILPVSEV